MKQGTRFSDKVIAFSLTERSRGARWKDIQNAIKREFQMEPPSERQMRNWYKQYGGGSINAEKLLQESLVKVAKDSTTLAAFTTQQYTIAQVIPQFMNAYREGKDPQIVGTKILLMMVNQMVGDNTYERASMEYESEREERLKTRKLDGWMNQPGKTPPGWTAEAITSEDSEGRR